LSRWVLIATPVGAARQAKQIQRSVHTSVRRREANIRTFIDLHNKTPKPFKWTKSADQILAKHFCHKAQLILCGEL
jgi:hypothetical protein